MDLALFVTGTVAAAVLLLMALEVLWPRTRSVHGQRGRRRTSLGGSSAPSGGTATAEVSASLEAQESRHEGNPDEVRPRERAPTATSPDPAETVPGRCRGLLAEHQVEEALALATDEVNVTTPDTTTTRAELWRLIAEARSRLGDREGANQAWSEALAAAPEAERDGYRRQFGSFVTQMVRRLITESRLIRDSATQLQQFRVARVLLAAARHEHVESPALAELDAIVNDGYGAACEAELRARLDAQAFDAAVQLADEVLADPALSSSRRDVIGELRAAAGRRGPRAAPPP